MAILYHTIISDARVKCLNYSENVQSIILSVSFFLTSSGFICGMFSTLYLAALYASPKHKMTCPDNTFELTIQGADNICAKPLTISNVTYLTLEYKNRIALSYEPSVPFLAFICTFWSIFVIGLILLLINCMRRNV